MARLVQTDVLIIGSGIAGAAAALRLARNPLRQIAVITGAPDPHESNTRYAQGGIVGRGIDDDGAVLAGEARLREQPAPLPTSAEVPAWDESGFGTEADPALIQGDMQTIQNIMWHYVSLVRSSDRLSRAIRELRHLWNEIETFYRTTKLSDGLIGLRNAVEAALIIAQAARHNHHSRGCHYRQDSAPAIETIPSHPKDVLGVSRFNPCAGVQGGGCNDTMPSWRSTAAPLVVPLVIVAITSVVATVIIRVAIAVTAVTITPIIIAVAVAVVIAAVAVTPVAIASTDVVAVTTIVAVVIVVVTSRQRGHEHRKCRGDHDVFHSRAFHRRPPFYSISLEATQRPCHLERIDILGFSSAQSRDEYNTANVIRRRSVTMCLRKN
jgi:hypothetical protein